MYVDFARLLLHGSGDAAARGFVVVMSLSENIPDVKNQRG